MENNLKVKAELLRLAGEQVDNMISSIEYYKKEVAEFEESDPESRSSWQEERLKGYIVTIEAYEKLIAYLEKLAN